MGRLGMDPSLILRNKKCGGGGTPGQEKETERERERESERGGRSHTLFCSFSLYIRPVGAGYMHCSTHKLVFKKIFCFFFSFAFCFLYLCYTLYLSLFPSHCSFFHISLLFWVYIISPLSLFCDFIANHCLSTVQTAPAQPHTV